MEINSVLRDYGYVLIFFIVGAVFAIGPLVMSYFVAPRSFGPARDEIYECGIPTFGSAWVQVARHLLSLCPDLSGL